MENISKALLIAGGILIAIVVLSMFLVMYNNVANISEAKEEKEKKEQLAAFNAQYEAYDKQIMYGVDVITLCNKIRNNNIKANNDDSKKIQFFVEGKRIDIIELTYLEDNTTSALFYIKDNNSGEKRDVNMDKEFLDFEKNLFKCERIEYNNLGRVKEVYIIEK